MAEYIEREVAISAFDFADADVIEDYGDGADFGFGRKNIRDVIQKVPAADVVPVVHGRWEEQDDGWGGTYYDCSACGESWTTIDGTPLQNNMNYCPNCGAKMDGGADHAAD